jgi:hypothetical protein
MQGISVRSVFGLNGLHLLQGDEELPLDVPQFVDPLLLLAQNQLVVPVLLVKHLDFPQQGFLLTQRLLDEPCEVGVGLLHALQLRLLLEFAEAVVLVQVVDEFGYFLLFGD